MNKKHYTAPSICQVQMEARLLDTYSLFEEVGSGVQLSRYTRLHGTNSTLWEDEEEY